MFIPPFVQKILDDFQKTINGNTEKLNCLETKMGLILKYNELEFGKINPDGFSVRDANKLQFVREKSITAEEVLDVRQDSGYFPRDGYIANLGDDSFKVILFGIAADQTTSEFTITPSTSYAIRSPVGKIKIIPLASTTAFYQVSVV